MGILVDTATLPPRTHVCAVRDVVGNVVAPSEIHFSRRDGLLLYRLEAWQLGATTLTRARGDQVRLRRTPRQVRSAAPEQAIFGFQLGGCGEYVQEGRQIRDAGGEVTLLDMTRPFVFGMGDGGLHGAISIAFDALALPVDTIRRSAPHLRVSPIHGLFSAHVRGLIPAAQALTDVRHAAQLGAATVELARALVATAGGDDPERNAPLRDALRARIRAYVQQHLTDRSLTVERIAAVHNVSVRQVYKLWAVDNELPLAEWIMSGRVDGARRELGRPDADAVSIAVVARRWGFADATHFSRRFRLAYGMSPREWRRLNEASRHGPHGASAEYGAPSATA